MSALEQRYRAALRWYPRRWRSENADAIVGTMLDQAEAEGRDRPARGELRDLAGSGIRVRIERVAPGAVRDRVAAIALALGSAYALIMFVGSEWAPFATTGPWNGWMLPPGPTYRDYSTVGFGPFASVMVIVFAMWIVAATLVLLRSRMATVMLLLTLPLLVWIRSVRLDDIGSMQPPTAALVLIGGLALLVCVGRPTRLPRRVVALMIATTTAALVLLMVSAQMAAIREGRISGYAYTFTVLFAPGIAMVLVLAGLILAIMRLRAWSTAALLSALPWLVLTPLYFFWQIELTGALAAALALVSIVAARLAWTRAPGSNAPSARSS